jgi:hypothetical protein
VPLHFGGYHVACLRELFVPNAYVGKGASGSCTARSPDAAGAPSWREPDVRPNQEISGCASLDGTFKEPACLQLAFRGEISSGDQFSQAIGGNIMFELMPSASGWAIEISPQAVSGTGTLESIWVVTPPYRSSNPRYLDTSYGVSAEDAVRETPRRFNFVLNEAQYQKAFRLVDLALSSRPLPDHRSQSEVEKESKDAAAGLMKFPGSVGQLSIVDSKVTLGKGSKDLGSLDWTKFEAILRVPCGFAAAKPTPELSVDRSNCDSQPGRNQNN